MVDSKSGKNMTVETSSKRKWGLDLNGGVYNISSQQIYVYIYIYINIYIYIMQTMASSMDKITPTIFIF